MPLLEMGQCKAQYAATERVALKKLSCTYESHSSVALTGNTDVSFYCVTQMTRSTISPLRLTLSPLLKTNRFSCLRRLTSQGHGCPTFSHS